MSYFKKIRVKTFPKIKNWKDSHNELRHNNHKSNAMLIWFSPFMYKFMKIGLFAWFGILFIFISIFLLETFILKFILAGMGGYMLVKGTIEYYKIKDTDMNMYDMFLRDY